MPKVAELLAVVEDGSPVDGALDTAEAKIGALVAVALEGYEATLAQLNAASANLEPVVTAAVGTVCTAVAEAVEAITLATETAAQEINTAVITAIETIKAEAIALAQSTDAEIRAAGEALYALVAELELAIVDYDFIAAHEAVKPVASGIIGNFVGVNDGASVKLAIDESVKALETLEPLAQELYDIAEGDVLYLLGQAEELAKAAHEIVKTAGLNIADDVIAAHDASVKAVYTAAGEAFTAVTDALDAYDTAVIIAAGKIVPAVTDAAAAIGAEVANVAAAAMAAVDPCMEKAEELQAIVDALAYAIYDATHVEIALNCGEKLEDKLITVDFNSTEIIEYMVAQIKGMVAEYIMSETKLVNFLNGAYGELVIPFLEEYEIDLTATAADVVWAPEYVEAKNEILTIVENVVAEQLAANGIGAVYTLDIGAMVQPLVDAQVGAGLVTIDLVLEVPVQALIVEAAEHALYKYFEFSENFPAELDAIRAENPEAQVAVMPINNYVVAALEQALPAKLAGLVDLSAYDEYFQMIVDVLNAQLFAYAAVNTNTTFVTGEDAITVTGADHTWGAWTSNGASGHTRTCSVCDATQTEVHDGDPCSKCNYAATPVTPVDPTPSYPVGGYVGYSWNCNGGKNCPSRQFEDLAAALDANPDIWWHEYTDYVISNKLMNGVSATKFDPNGTTTRAMLVTVLWRQAGSPVVKAEMPFEDVAADTWYTEAIRWAASKGIVDGMSDTEFAPDAKITREQIVTIFYRYAKVKGVNVNRGNANTITKFCDAENVSDWAYDAAKWACGIGFVDGKDDTHIAPADNATRAEMATLIMRFIEKVL